MSQHDYTIDNGDGATFRADINAVLAAILTANSGSTAPTTTAPFMLWADTANGVIKQRNAADTAWVTLWTLGGQPLPVGTQLAFAGRVAPAGFLLCYGQAVSRTTYADLYNVLCPVIGTFTVTIASPAVFTMTAHGMSDGDLIRFFTTGALPTGLSVNTDYYIASSTANTFQVSATRGGAAIATSGTQSGTHTFQFFPYGAGNGTTTFNVPDKRGRVSVGRDDMGGLYAGRMTTGGSGVTGTALGASGGSETHTLTTAQIPAHNHPIGDSAGATGSASGGGKFFAGTGTATTTANSTGGGGAHNNTQPSQVDNWIIKF